MEIYTGISIETFKWLVKAQVFCPACGDWVSQWQQRWLLPKSSNIRRRDEVQQSNQESSVAWSIKLLSVYCFLKHFQLATCHSSHWFLTRTQWIGLRWFFIWFCWENLHRKPSIFPSNMAVSCKPIPWKKQVPGMQRLRASTWPSLLRHPAVLAEAKSSWRE